MKAPLPDAPGTKVPAGPVSALRFIDLSFIVHTQQNSTPGTQESGQKTMKLGTNRNTVGIPSSSARALRTKRRTSRDVGADTRAG